MDWDLELHAERLQHMLTVYQDHIEELEAEAKEMQKEIVFLKEQLDLKTLGYEKYEDLNQRR
jgi:predicted RNase H-like nuclease (RuvC/YqgF family)